jgi:hypothetical protein
MTSAQKDIHLKRILEIANNITNAKTNNLKYHLLLQKEISNYYDKYLASDSTEGNFQSTGGYPCGSKEKKWRIGRCDIHGDIAKMKMMSNRMRNKEGHARKEIYKKKYGVYPVCSCYE